MQSQHPLMNMDSRLNGAQPSAPPNSYDDMTTDHVVKINFGLSWKHIAAVVFGLPAFAGSLATAGWLVLPAKQSDVVKIEHQLTGVKVQVETLQNASLKLTEAVQMLTTSVQALTDRPQPVSITLPAKRR